MKKLRFLSILLLTALLLGLAAPSAAALDDPELDGTYAAMLVAEKGKSETVLFAKNDAERLFPASLTKVMTVLLAVEAVEAGTVKLTDLVTAQPGFDFDMIIGGSSIYLVTGETMTLENLLYGAMVASGNDACNVIAEYIGGSISDFVEAMNTRAAALGCQDTHFANPHGLNAPDHYTTVRDFMKILQEAAGHELFMEICDTINYTIPATNMSNERKLENTNSLINPTNPLYPGDYGYEYAHGVKTGHTSDAGYCLATTAQKDDIRLLAVVMKCDALETEDGGLYYCSFADARTLFRWGFDNFSYKEILKSTEMITSIGVEMGAEADSVSVRPSLSIGALLPNDLDADAFERTVTLYPTGNGDGTTLMAPVTAGTTVGEISVSYNGKVYGTSPLVTSTGVELSRVQFMKGQLTETLRRPAVIITFWGLVLLLLTYIALVIRYRVKRRAYQKRLAAARQIRLDLEDEEEEIRYERRRRSAVPVKTDLAIEPDSYKKPEKKKTVPRQKPAVDEPTRVSGELPDASKVDEPTIRRDAPEETPSEERDYFEEFFGKK